MPPETPRPLSSKSVDVLLLALDVFLARGYPKYPRFCVVVVLKVFHRYSAGEFNLARVEVEYIPHLSDLRSCSTPLND